MSLADQHAAAIAVWTWARDQRPYLTSAQGDMLMLLASHQGQRGCFPSLTTLILKSGGRSRSSVLQLLADLTELRLISSRTFGKLTYRYFHTERSLAADAIGWAANQGGLSAPQAEVLKVLTTNGPYAVAAGLIDRDAAALTELAALGLITTKLDKRNRLTITINPSDRSDSRADVTPGANPTGRTAPVQPVGPGTTATTDLNYGEERACARDPQLSDLIQKILNAAMANRYETGARTDDGEPASLPDVNDNSPGGRCAHCEQPDFGNHRLVQRPDGDVIWCCRCRRRRPLALALLRTDDPQLRERAAAELVAALYRAVMPTIDIEQTLLTIVEDLAAEANGQVKLVA